MSGHAAALRAIPPWINTEIYCKKRRGNKAGRNEEMKHGKKQEKMKHLVEEFII